MKDTRSLSLTISNTEVCYANIVDDACLHWFDWKRVYLTFSANECSIKTSFLTEECLFQFQFDLSNHCFFFFFLLFVGNGHDNNGGGLLLGRSNGKLA